VYTRVSLYVNVVYSEGFHKLSDPPFRRSIRFIYINITIKTTSVCDGDARSVGGGRGWLAGDTDGLAGWLAGWPMTGDGGRGQPASSRR